MICYGSKTNEDGRCLDLMTSTDDSTKELSILGPGLHKITFDVKGYFESQNKTCFYPWVEVRDIVHCL
jgi:5-hydroxyisourate hydrolase